MKSDLPNSSQFSPVQTPLPQLLAIIKAQQPSRQAVSQSILEVFFPDRASATSWDWKLADNTVIAMSQYGLVNKPREDQGHASLTELGMTLAQLAEEGQLGDLYDTFVRHILLNRRGLEVVACIQDVVASGQQPTKARLVKELGQRGIYHPPNGTHLNGMRQWFEAAGLVPKDQWIVNEKRLGEILGTDSASIEQYAGLTQEQRDFAKAFARLNVDEAWSNEVADYATALFSTDFPEGGLPQSVLFALRDAGLIECEKTTTGRGAKPYRVRPTEKLRNEMIEPILSTIEQSAFLLNRNAYRLPLSVHLQNLTSHNAPARLTALEAIVFSLSQELGLIVRERWTETANSIHLSLVSQSRRDQMKWQVLCKDTPKITEADIAIETGLAVVNRPTFIMVLTSGKLDKQAATFQLQASRAIGVRYLTMDRSSITKLQTQSSVVSLLWN